MKAFLICIIILLLSCPALPSKLGDEEQEKTEGKTVELKGKAFPQADDSIGVAEFIGKKDSFPNQDVKLRFNARGEIEETQKGCYEVELYDRKGESFRFEFGEDGLTYIRSIPIGKVYTESEEEFTRKVLRTPDNIIRNYFVYVHVTFHKKGEKDSDGKEIPTDSWNYRLVGKELSKDPEPDKPKYTW